MDKQTREYLLKRQTALVSDQHSFEEMLTGNQENVIFSPDEIRRLIVETQARRNELALMVTCFQIDDEHRVMDERDRLTEQLRQAEDICKEVNASVPLGQGAREARDTLRQRLADLNANR